MNKFKPQVMRVLMIYGNFQIKNIFIFRKPI